MKRFVGAIAAAAASVCLVPSASAAVFNFSYDSVVDGARITTSGLMFTSNQTNLPTGQNTREILGVTGQRGNTKIQGMLPLGTTFQGLHTDNILYLSGEPFNIKGVGYSAQGSSNKINLFSFEGALREYTESANYEELGGSAVSNFSFSKMDVNEFSFSYTASVNGVAVPTSGTLYTTATTRTLNGREAYTILGVTGQRGSETIERLLETGDAFGGGAPFDNVLYKSSYPFSGDGIGFTISGSKNLIALGSWFENNYEGMMFEDGTYNSSYLADFRLVQTVTAAVPEPATWGMMLLGFGLAGASSRRNSRRKLASA